MLNLLINRFFFFDVIQMCFQIRIILKKEVKLFCINSTKHIVVAPFMYKRYNNNKQKKHKLKQKIKYVIMYLEMMFFFLHFKQKLLLKEIN